MACQDCGENSQTLPVGPAGENGTNGTNGSDGGFGGYSSSWLFDGSATNSAGLASRYFRVNGGLTLTSITNPSAITAIYINKYNSENDDIEDFLGSFENNTNFGKIRIFKEFDSSVYYYFEITSVGQMGGVTTLLVTYIDGNGTIATNDNIVISFTPNGTPATPLTIEAGGESQGSLSISVPTGSLGIISGTSSPSLTGGVYLAWASFTVFPEANTSSILSFQFHNGSSLVGVQRDVDINNNGTVDQSNSLLSFSFNDIFEVGPSGVISLYMERLGGGNIDVVTQSVTYLKIA